jgi:cation:H+ antiporter
VGLTIVAFGTSSPEVAVSVGAAMEGNPDIALGNVVGSNIFNVLFILGISALITPLVINAQIIRQEVPIMIGVSLLLLVLVLDSHLSRWDAGLLLTMLIAYTLFLIVQSRRQTAATEQEYSDEVVPRSQWDRHWAVQVLLVVSGLALLVLGSQWLVQAAITFAQWLGISDVVIALTIVAAGTSMPEVATSIMAAVKGERDIWVMLAVAVACLPVFLTAREIARWEGGVFLAYYLAYTAYLILAAQQHDALPAYSYVMLSFVIPLTIVTLLACMLRPAK